MHAYDEQEGNATGGENDVSEKEIFLEIDDYAIGTDIIQKSETGKHEQGIEEEADSGSIFDK